MYCLKVSNDEKNKSYIYSELDGTALIYIDEIYNKYGFICSREEVWDFVTKDVNLKTTRINYHYWFKSFIIPAEGILKNPPFGGSPEF